MKYFIAFLLCAGSAMAQNEASALADAGMKFLARGNRVEAEAMFYKALLYDGKNVQALWELAKLDDDGDMAFKAYCLSESKERKAMMPTLAKINATCARIASAYEDYDESLLQVLKQHPESEDIIRSKLKLKHVIARSTDDLIGRWKTAEHGPWVVYEENGEMKLKEENWNFNSTKTLLGKDAAIFRWNSGPDLLVVFVKTGQSVAVRCYRTTRFDKDIVKETPMWEFKATRQ